MKKGFFMSNNMMHNAIATEVPKVGDIVYVPSAAYCDHGIDDRQGGRAEVVEVTMSMSAGNMVPFIRVKPFPFVRYNWPNLFSEQTTLEARFKDNDARPDPDYRAEFNKP